jgi:hypothetical protein
MMNIRAYLEALFANHTPRLTALDPALEPADTKTQLLPRETPLAAATRRVRETAVPKPTPPPGRQVRDSAWPNSWDESCWDRAWKQLTPAERAWSSGGGS